MPLMAASISFWSVTSSTYSARTRSYTSPNSLSWRNESAEPPCATTRCTGPTETPAAKAAAANRLALSAILGINSVPCPGAPPTRERGAALPRDRARGGLQEDVQRELGAGIEDFGTRADLRALFLCSDSSPRTRANAQITVYCGHPRFWSGVLAWSADTRLWQADSVAALRAATWPIAKQAAALQRSRALP